MPIGSLLVAVNVIAGTGLGAALLAFALDIVGLQLLNVALRKFAAPDLESRNAAREIMTRSSTEPRKMVYGDHVVSGPVLYVNVAGTDNEQLFHIIALAAHEIDSYIGFYIDSDYIPLSDVNDINASPEGDGSVNTGSHGFGPIGGTFITYLRGHLGTATQAADAMAVSAFSDWTSAHQAKGVAYLVSRFDYIDGSEDVWSGGVQNIRARIKGKKDIYDPRLDSSPGNDPSNASYQAWTDNPALILANYLTDSDLGMGWATSEIDWQSVNDSADYCDALVPIPPTASPTNTEKRYRCDVVLFATDEPKDNVAKILSSFNGRLLRSGGQWKIEAGYSAPTVTLTENHLAGPLQFRSQPTARDRYNTVRGVYIDRNRNWKTSQFHEQTDATMQTRDGGAKLYRDIALEAVTREYQAQRVAYNVLQQSDNPGVCIFPANYYPADLTVGDTVAVTVDELSWSSKVFRVQKWESSDQGVQLTLREESSAAYADPGVTDYTSETSAGAIVPPTYTPPPPGTLTATGKTGGIELSWIYLPIGQSNIAGFNLYASVDSSWSNASLIAFTRNTSYFHQLPPGAERYYWVRSVSRAGTESTRQPDSDTSTITAVSISEFFTGRLSDDPFFNSGTTWVNQDTGIASWTHVTSGGFENGPFWRYNADITNTPYGWLKPVYSAVTDLPKIVNNDRVYVRVRWKQG